MSGHAVIITRAEPGAAETSVRVTAMGHAAICSPALSLHAVEPTPDLPLEGALGVVFTSANGVLFLSEATANRSLKAWCVGPATHAGAKAAGFADAVSAEGNAQDLAALITREAEPSAGHLLHVANTAAGDTLQTQLTEAGFDVRFAGLYEPRDAQALSDEAATALSQTLCAVLIHSAKGAAAFAKLAGTQTIAHATFIAVSNKAAEPIHRLGPTLIAARPNEDALLAALADWAKAL